MLAFALHQRRYKDRSTFSKECHKMACELRVALTELGVTFIKLGQFLSVRRDILPLELAQELSLLQDQVPSFSFEEVQTIVEKELAAPLSHVFQFFESYPMASASIGQVHRAILKNGRAVAVKVQRTNLARTVHEDLVYMRFLIGLAKVLRLKGDWQGWFALVDEFERSIFIEMDYLQEGRNADKLRQILRNFPAIVIPRVVWRYSTKHVLTEQLCEGTRIDKISSFADIDTKRLAKQMVEAYLEQIVVHGYFHADPHAGNLAVSETGQLIIYDFGMMGYITDSQREGMLRLVLSIMDNNLSRFIESFTEIGIIRPISQADRDRLEKVIEPVWTQFRRYPISDIDLSIIEKEIDLLLAHQYFRLPANLAYLIRMVVSLDAIVHALNPDFNFARVASPYFKRIIST